MAGPIATLIWPAALGAVVTAIAIVALRPLAMTLDLVDRPGGRKTHHGEVPVVGGLAMFIGVVVGLGLLEQNSASLNGPLAAAFGLLVLVGLFDDRFSLPPWVRLSVHAAVALMLVRIAGCRITTLGDAFGAGEIHFAGVWVYIVSVVLIAAAINAFNMLDGMDGLAGTTAGVAVCALGYVAWSTGDFDLLGVCTVLAGAICGFLFFNLPWGGDRPLRCFMGDAGSTLLGVAVAWLLVRLSQPSAAGPGAINPATALWIGGLPAIELVWSSIRRLVRGRSPFEADAEHFHHLLMAAGFSVRGAFAMLMLLTTAMAALGLSLQSVGTPEYWSLLILVTAAIAIIRFMHRVGALLQYLPRQARRGLRQARMQRDK